MKLLITILFNLFGFYGYCQGIQNQNLSSISIQDSLVNNKKFKRQLLEKEFLQIKNDSSEISNYYCSVKLCIDYFIVFREPQEIDSTVLNNLKQISNIFIENRTPLLLTTGTDGNCGRGCQKLDTLTKEYNFIYIAVGDLSCFPGRIDLAIATFNNETKTYLDKINKHNWKSELENKIKKYNKANH